MALVEDNVADLRTNVIEFVKRYKNLVNERTEISDRIKELEDEFKSRIDLKTFRAALRVAKAEDSVSQKDEYDTILETLRKEFAVLP